MVSAASRVPRVLTALGTAVVTAAGVLVASPAVAAPVVEVHDFAGGDMQGWFAYANTGTVTAGVESEQLCATVDGGENPWDVAVQHDGVTYDRDATYTVAFDASSTVPVTLPMQGGAGYPAAFGSSFDLPDTAQQHIEFSFSPADWPTGGDSPLADDWSTTTGNVSFQLGAQEEPYTVCFDNFSITDAAAEQVPGGDFEDGTLDPFFSSGAGITTTVEGGVLCAELPAGTTNRWDQIVGVNGIVIEPGTTYTLSFDASSSSGRPIRAIIGDDDEPYGVLFEQNPTLTADLEHYEFTYTASAGFPASAGEEPPSGQVAFQVGGAAEAWTLCLDNVSLLGGTVEEPYAPETGPRVRVNQVGYLPEGPKQATLVTESTEPAQWELRTEGGVVAASGTTTPTGVDETAGLNVHVIDFSDVTAPGSYTLAADGDESYGFVLDAEIYQQLRFDALNYFYPVRSGIAIDGSILEGQPDAEEYTRDAGHVEDPESSLVANSPNRGDYDVECLTPATEGDYWMYGDWSCDYTLDVVGGWYDAGDHGKYVVNGGIAVAQLLGTYERSLSAPTGTTGAFADGSLNIPESGNGVPDVLDEARWELEWMKSMQAPSGEYAGMVHHKIADADWTGLPLLPSEDPQERYLHRPSTAATLNLAAVAAQGARLWEKYDAEFAEELLAAGRAAWEAALATPDLFAPAPNADPSPGSGPYNDQEVNDEFYWAAAELFLTTGDGEFQDYILGSEYHTADIWTEDGFDWGHTAALGRLDLATVESDIPGRDDIRKSVLEGADRYLRWQAEQPFGTTYPGKDGVYQWGSNSMVLNNQVVLATAFDLTGNQEYADAVIEAMDYLLGRNALNNSYITGYGDLFSDDQHSRWFADSIEPSLPNPPRGSVAGGPNSDTGTWDPVISGLYNEDHMCAPQLCYLDDIQSWSTNEITVNWNSAMSWVASFVADQRAGDESDAGRVVWIKKHPEDVAVKNGGKATFTASATGDPRPSVRWQALLDGEWKDIRKANSSTLTVRATKKSDGAQYRAVFTNEFGSVYTDAATLTVKQPAQLDVSPGKVEPGEKVTLRGEHFAPGETVALALDGKPAGTAKADGKGRFTTTVSVPAATRPGSHKLTAAGADSGWSASDRITVVKRGKGVSGHGGGSHGGGSHGGGSGSVATGSIVSAVAAFVVALFNRR